MTTRMKTSIVAIAVLLIGSSLTWASEPNDNKIPLKFEIQSTPIGPLDASRAGRSGHPGRAAFAAYKPTYAAGIPFEGPAGYLAHPGSANMNGFLHSVFGETMGTAGTDPGDRLSAAQREFMRATKGLLEASWDDSAVPQWYPSGARAESPRQLLLYAMTLEDAKAMAEAYVRFVMGRWQYDADQKKEWIGDAEQTIAAAERRTGELTKLIENSKQALEALGKKVPYRTEDEAMKAVSELDRMLNAAQVDIAGIRARIGAIQEHLQSGKSPYDETIKAKLQGMFVEESVALQGAEARRAMATQLRADASRFLDLRASVANADGEMKELQDKKTAAQKRVIALQHDLERVMTQKPEIADHTIPIYPVAWATETPQN